MTDMIRLNVKPQCRLSIALVVLTVLLGLCGRSMSQISGSKERIGCVEVNMTRTCFDIYDASSTWADAWSRCQGSGTQLAVLRTPETDRLVGKYMDRITQNLDDDFPVWIGGRELNDSAWNWTDGKPFVSQNTSTMLTLFSAQPIRYENCATVEAMQSNLTLVFQSRQCKESLQFICQEPNTTSTDTCYIDGNVGIVINNSCYAAFISSDPLSWFEARYKCQRLGADLAVFDETSSVEQGAIYDLLPNATLFWIGLRKTPWIWVTSFDSGAKTVIGLEEMSYSGWEPEEPRKRNRSCLAMVGSSGVSHGWLNYKCDELYPYICQQTTILTTTPPPTTAPPTTAATSDFYDYDSDYNNTSKPDSFERNIVHIVVPVVIVAVVILVIGFSIYCYFAQRRVDYVQQK